MSGSSYQNRDVVAAGYLQSLLGFCESEAWRARVIKEARLPVRAINSSDSYVSVRHWLRTIKLMMSRYGHQGLGLAYGSSMRITSYGFLGYAMLSSPNLMAACEVLAAFHSSRFGPCQLTWSQSANRVSGRLTRGFPWQGTMLEDSRRLDLFFNEGLLSSHALNLGHVLQRPIKGLRIHFGCERPAYIDQFLSVFQPHGVEVCFDQTFTGLGFDAAEKDAPLPMAHAGTLAQSLRLCEEEALAYDLLSDSTPQRVRRFIKAQPPAVQPPLLQTAALALHMSESTLRRRLKQHGVSYQSLLDETLQERACHLLSMSDRSIADISIALGYSTSANFIRAFSRWSGQTPNEYRLKLKR